LASDRIAPVTGVRTITVEDDEADLRLDRWFRRRFPDLGHGRLERLLRTGQVRVDGRRAKSCTRLAAGQTVRVPPFDGVVSEQPAARPARPVSPEDAAALQKAVLYKDDWVIALSKPAGLAVQGGTGQQRHLDGMLDALRFDKGEAPRLVHRLDRDTSGVLMLARTAVAARRLAGAFRGRDAQKVYWALVVGVPEHSRGLIDLPLAKRPGRGGETVGIAAGDEDDEGEEIGGGDGQTKAARTLYRVVEERALGDRRGPRVAWLVLMPLTGRTHQLRAHCAALGTPIAGDGKYGGKRAFPGALAERVGRGPAGKLMLHARELALPHPDDGTTLRVAAPLPEHLAAVWHALDFDERKADGAAQDLIDYAEGLAHSPPGTAPKPRRRRGDRPKPQAPAKTRRRQRKR
jgi:23S rRNA pseudouridine955/2504/2580 synthase